MKSKVPHFRSSLLEGWRFDACLTILVAIGYSLFGGSLITYDGRQYLSTVNSISQHTLSEGYLLGRPPFYPLFLSVILSIWNSDRFLIFTQVAIMLFSALYFFRVLKKAIAPIFPRYTFPRVLPVIFVTSPTILGHGSTILQQSLFVTEAAILLTLLLHLLMNPRKSSLYVWLALLIVATTLTGQGMLAFNAGVLLCVVLIIVQSTRKSHFSIRQFVFGSIALLSLPLTLLGFSIFEEWAAQKSDVISVGLPAGSSITSFPSYFQSNPQRAANNLVEAYVTQSGLIPSIQSKGLLFPEGNGSARFFENRAHAENVFIPERKCGIADTNDAGPWYKHSKDVLQQNCAPFNFPKSFRWLPFLLGFLVSLVSFAFFPFSVILFYFAIKSRDLNLVNIILILILPSFLLRCSYIILGLQPDRYALPTLISAFVVVIFVIEGVKNFVLQNANRA